MADENNSATGNAGTQTGPKMVPESDLLAVKVGLTKQIDDVKEASANAINEAKTVADTHYQNLLREKTAREQLENQVKELTPHKERADKLQADVTAISDANKGMETKLRELRIDLISTRYGVAPDSIKEKTLAELTTLEEALKITGGGGKRTYDTGVGSGSGNAGNPFAAEMAEIAEAKAKK
jgi:hypothetical protein